MVILGGVSIKGEDELILFTCFAVATTRDEDEDTERFYDYDECRGVAGQLIQRERPDYLRSSGFRRLKIGSTREKWRTPDHPEARKKRAIVDKEKDKYLGEASQLLQRYRESVAEEKAKEKADQEKVFDSMRQRIEHGFGSHPVSGPTVSTPRGHPQTHEYTEAGLDDAVSTGVGTLTLGATSPHPGPRDSALQRSFGTFVSPYDPPPSTSWFEDPYERSHAPQNPFPQSLPNFVSPYDPPPSTSRFQDPYESSHAPQNPFPQSLPNFVSPYDPPPSTSRFQDPYERSHAPQNPFPQSLPKDIEKPLDFETSPSEGSDTRAAGEGASTSSGRSKSPPYHEEKRERETQRERKDPSGESRVSQPTSSSKPKSSKSKDKEPDENRAGQSKSSDKPKKSRSEDKKPDTSRQSASAGGSKPKKSKSNDEKPDESRGSQSKSSRKPKISKSNDEKPDESRGSQSGGGSKRKDKGSEDNTQKGGRRR